MFPESFAARWIERLTRPGESILDPFCGRGTLPFQALLMGRRAVGCDTNPVACCVSRAKTNAPDLSLVIARIDDLERKYTPRHYNEKAKTSSAFFKLAYHSTTLRQLLYLRENLKHQDSAVDCMIAALALGSLHGEALRSERFLSNQMPHTISTKPEYSIRFWQRHGHTPPERDAFELLKRQATFRYHTGRPNGRAIILQTDMREIPRRLKLHRPSSRCVITSPPYFDVTNYSEDQWLRLWFLGGEPKPIKTAYSRDDRHGNLDNYWALLADMWRVLGLALGPKSNVVIRLGARRITPDRLVSGLMGVARASGRRVRLVAHEVSEINNRQTRAFRPGTIGCKLEVDCHFHLG